MFRTGGHKRRALCVLVALMCAFPAIADARVFSVQVRDGRVFSLGGFHPTRNAYLRAAVRRFGEPTNRRLRYGGTACLVEWRDIGLAMWFGDLSGAGAACENDGGLADSATIKGRRARPWRTSTRVRIGTPSARVPALNPGAALHGSSWWLATGRTLIGDCSIPSGCPYPVLEARVTNGRVSSLRAAIGAAGE
jgi:hypothetical protein